VGNYEITLGDEGVTDYIRPRNIKKRGRARM